MRTTEADFTLDVTLPGAKSATETDGDIIIEGLASDFGLDRQDEAFMPGAFTDAIDKFLTTNPILLFDHQNSKALGQVLALEPRTEGLYMKARIDEPTEGSWAEDVVRKVRRGTIRGLSVRGLFKRTMTPRGPRIHEADLAEISVTPLPVNPRTLFGVAQKSFGDDAFDQEIARRSAEVYTSDYLDAYEAYLNDVALAAAQKSTFRPWNGSPGRFDDDSYRKAAVLDRGDSYEGKARYALPVREPDGTLNCRAVAAARGRLAQVKGATAEAREAATWKLDRFGDQCEQAHAG